MSQTTIAHWLQAASQTLTEHHIPSARLDCLLMLEDELKKDRSSLLAHQDSELSKEQLGSLNNMLDRRSQNEPMAYIRGFVEFYGYSFNVTPAVLIPRPESEAFIDELTKLPGNHSLVDIGTGSGCIGIAVKLTLPKWQVDGYDISGEAIEVATQNAAKLNAEVPFFVSALLEKVHKSYSVITANLPYVPLAYDVNDPVHFEPELAVYGGQDGMDLYKQFWLQLKKTSAKYVLTESLPKQHGVQRELAKTNGYSLKNTNDYVQVFERII